MNDVKGMGYLVLLLVLLAGCKEPPVEVIDEGGRFRMARWFLFEPEPGVHCVSVKWGFGSSVDCWKVVAHDGELK